MDVLRQVQSLIDETKLIHQEFGDLLAYLTPDQINYDILDDQYIIIIKVANNPEDLFVTIQRSPIDYVIDFSHRRGKEIVAISSVYTCKLLDARVILSHFLEGY